MTLDIEVERLINSTPKPCIWVGTVSTETLVPILRVGAVGVYVDYIDVLTTGPSDVEGDASNHWRLTVEGMDNTAGTPAFIDTPVYTHTDKIRAKHWKRISVNQVLRDETIFLRLYPFGSPSAMVGVSVAVEAEVR